MSFVDEVGKALREQKKPVEKPMTNDAFIKKLQQLILLDAKNGKVSNGVITGRMLFTQETFTDDSADGWGWYGEKCPPLIETFTKKRRYGLFKYKTFTMYRLVPSSQICNAYEYVLNWAKTENVQLSELYLYDRENGEVLNSTSLEFSRLDGHVLGDVVLFDFHDSNGSFLKRAAYCYAVNYRLSICK